MSDSIRPWYWPDGGQPDRADPLNWIVEGVVAASWWPDPEVRELYRSHGIRAIINCCEFDNRADVASEFDYYHISVPDYGVPTEEQVEQCLDILDRHHAAQEPVVIHCVAGCGRTGQFLVAWCARAGFLPTGRDPIEWIRSRRPCCLETSSQVVAARRLAQRYQQR